MHRNSLEISIFLLHMKKFFGDLNIRTRAVNDGKDGPLVESCYRSSKLPILILVKDDLQDKIILDNIKQNHINPTHDTVILMYDDLIGQRKDIVHEWCQANNWSMIHCSNMIGTEASATVLFDLKNDSIEFYSRAKHLLVIVHR